LKTASGATAVQIVPGGSHRPGPAAAQAAADGPTGDSRAAIETAGADALTARRDPAIYEQLTDLVAQIEDVFARGDVAGVLDGDRLFRATLVAAACSPGFPVPRRGRCRLPS
jgi:DNA-binding GntR family transcriptional regulator